MAENLSQRFGTGVQKLKIGKSFENSKKSGGSGGGGGNSEYFSIKYDFKPVSVDQEKMGVLEVKEQRSVSVALPHVDGSGQTNYKGNVKPANTKECILIIDHETGELTLERLNSQIMVKKTRTEKIEKPSNPYEVRERPESNPYEVRERPKSNSYEVKERPQPPQERGPRTSSSSRPNTPLQRNKTNKSPQGATNGVSGFRDTPSLPDMSPLHSNKSSPAWGGDKGASGGGGASGGKVEVDSLGRPIKTELSDSSSDSGSSSGSDSDSGPEDYPIPAKKQDKAVAMPMTSSMPTMPVTGSMPTMSMPGSMPTMSMPGDLSLPLPGAPVDRGPGVLPKARPDSKWKTTTPTEDDSRPKNTTAAAAMPDVDPTARRKSRPISRPPPSSRASNSSRPTPPQSGRPTPPQSGRPTPPQSSRPPPPHTSNRPTPPPPQPPQNPGRSSNNAGGRSHTSSGGGGGGGQLSMPNFLGDDLHLSDSDD